MATKYEKYTNSAFSYLEEPVGAGDLTIKLYDVRRFPSDGTFRLRVGREIMGVTFVDTDNRTMNVTRGIEGTTAKAHSVNSLAISVLTQGGLDQMLTNRVLFAKTRPQIGHLSNPSDQRVKVADLTWDNQGSATATDVNGTIWMNGLRATGDDVHSLLTTVPSTPWTFTLGWRPYVANNITNDDGFGQAGMVLKNSGNARLVLFNVYLRTGAASTPNQGNLKTSVEYMTSATVASSTAAGPTGYQRRYDDIMWHRVTDDGTTNLTFEVSRDGVNWQTFATLGRTAWLTSGCDRIGFNVNPASTDSGGGTNMDNYAAFVHMSFS